MTGRNLRTALPETVRSLRDFGVRRTLAVIGSRLGDLLFDLRHGTDTVQTVSVEELDVEGPSRGLGQRYQPTGSSALPKILRRLPLAGSDVFVDYGCGKGRPLLLATRFRFARIVGIELSAALAEVARGNIARFAASRRLRTLPEVVHADAALHRLADDETVFYLFHPFGPPVLAAVLAEIEASLRRRPRRAWLVYYLPVHRERTDGLTLFELRESPVINGYDCRIYIHEPAP